VSWQDFGPSRPLEVEGGVKARSKRGAIGEQWWSRRFTGVLESFGMTGRLARGRNYARRGQVIGFEISCGYVTAQVQGSRPKPYRVQMQVTPLTTAQWRKVEQALAAQALFRARLLAGEMPPEIEDVFASCGTPLFPRSARDLDMSCSCPDWGVPCKHLAAVCYVLAEAFDLDPFAILAWRGRGRDELLAAMRLTGREADETARPLIDVTDRPLSECMPDFWSPGMSTARLRALSPVPATAPDLLLRTFEPPQLQVRNNDLITLLGPAYHRLAVPDEPADG
jgi:uncharacterized Zn finger protein